MSVPRLILLQRTLGLFVVVRIVVVVVVLAGGCVGRWWSCSFVCLVCVFLVLVKQRLGWLWIWTFLRWLSFINPKESGSFNPKGSGSINPKRSGF
ncbi:hypothetical protein MtrunA17_Chr4g0073011 [Medicago truncatula]|nr:hypothetical protein MtrunA17_Chr4g0073011 [Medicago truncatula]